MTADVGTLFDAFVKHLTDRLANSDEPPSVAMLETVRSFLKDQMIAAPSGSESADSVAKLRRKLRDTPIAP